CRPNGRTPHRSPPVPASRARSATYARHLRRVEARSVAATGHCVGSVGPLGERPHGLLPRPWPEPRPAVPARHPRSDLFPWGRREGAFFPQAVDGGPPPTSRRRHSGTGDPRAGDRSQRPSTPPSWTDRKSTRLNSSHVSISYAVFCLKKKKQTTTRTQRTHPGTLNARA